jgi:hypothetical protein
MYLLLSGLVVWERFATLLCERRAIPIGITKSPKNKRIPQEEEEPVRGKFVADVSGFLYYAPGNARKII